MLNKLEKPHNELIFRVAVNMAAVWFETARSSDIQPLDKNGKSYKNNNARFARENLELFVPHAINTLIEMLKPTSNCTEHMRAEIYEALMGYKGDLNPVDIVQSAMPINFKKFDDKVRAFEKQNPKFPLIMPTEEKKTVLHYDKPKKVTNG